MTPDETLVAAILARFENAAAFHVWLMVNIWPAMRERDRRNFAQEYAAKAAARQAKADAAQQAKDKRKAERRAAAEARDLTPKRPSGFQPAINERFIDLNGAMLTEREVRRRAGLGLHVREKATGRIMRYHNVPVSSGGPRWIEVNSP